MDALDMILKENTPTYITLLENKGFEYCEHQKNGSSSYCDGKLRIEITQTPESVRGSGENFNDHVKPGSIDIEFYSIEDNKHLVTETAGSKEEITGILKRYL